MCATSARGLAIFGRDAVEHAVADQIADVRRHPVGAGFDELIVVELLDVLLQHRDLLGQHGEQIRERARQRALLQLVVLLLLERVSGVPASISVLQLDVTHRDRRAPASRRERGLRLIADAQDRRQQIEQFVRVEAHAASHLFMASPEFERRGVRA